MFGSHKVLTKNVKEKKKRKKKVKKNKNRLKVNKSFLYRTSKSFHLSNSSIKRLNNFKIYKFLTNFNYI